MTWQTYLTTREYAQLVGCSERTARRRAEVMEMEGGAVKYFCRWYFHAREDEFGRVQLGWNNNA